MKRIVALVPMLLLAGVQPARAQVVANAQVAATAEDTALARTLLTNALRAFRRIETPIGQSHFEERFVAQFAAWGMHDQAWDLALAFDTSAAQGGTDSGYWLTARLIGALYEQGDSVAVASRLDRMPAHVRDGILPALASRYRCNDPTQTERVLAQIRHPFHRARALAENATPCTPGDTLRPRQWLRAAIDIAGDTLTGIRAHQRMIWLHNLRRSGGDVTVHDLVEASRREEGDVHRARLQVVETLISYGEHAAAMPLLDSLQRHYAQASATPRPYWIIARIHELRGTAADSVIAQAIRDTIAQMQQVRIPPADAHVAQGNARGVLLQAINAMDMAQTREALASALRMEDPSGTIAGAADHMRMRIVHPRPGEDSLAAHAVKVAFARQLYDELWQATSGMTADDRDSARVAVIAMLATFDQQRALAAAQRDLRIARMRERAIADVVTRMVSTDADGAAALADPLRDAVARNTAYLPLTERAVAGGRLALAARFADRTANGEARVRANYVVARALFAADSVAQAQTRIASVLPDLNPVWRCEGYCTGIADDASGFAGMSRSLIGDVVALAFRAGATRSLREWVVAHADAERRAAAALAVVEGLAQHRLGRWNYYPMH